VIGSAAIRVPSATPQGDIARLLMQPDDLIRIQIGIAWRAADLLIAIK